jgi:solute carrier family 25 carnitine/acylcarnitine transporter 20/29
LDTIKSKMQAQATYYNTSAFRTLANVYKNEGFLALYRGLLPPLVGSTVFRSVQFTAYGLAYGAARDHPFLMREIPLLGDMEMRVVAAGVFASTARAITESPLDFIKVRKQTGPGWTAAATPAQALRQPLTELRHLYTGFGLTWAR